MITEKENNRLLPLEKAYNARDLGGYAAFGGKHVKWGKVFRSGDLNELGRNDLELLEKTGILTFIDFRSEQEQKSAPDKTPLTLIQSVSLPINAGNLSDMIFSLNHQDIPSMMEEVYEYIVSEFTGQYKKFFEILASDNSSPLLFHCSAGKDRTGIGAALFLWALGVDKDTIFEDYMLSAEYLKGKYDFIIRKYPQFEPLTTVKPQYLERAFNTIQHKFGGMDNYLTKYLCADINRLRDLYTG